MSPHPAGRLRRLIPSLFVLVLVFSLYLVARLPVASAADQAIYAARFRFTEREIALPPGLAQRTVRQVNPAYENIRSWISSVGAGIAVNDLDGGRVPNDLCLVDPRSDSVVVTPVPGSQNSYQPFVLDPAPLPVNSAIAPMGCAPGDFNGDGGMDLLVYYWGRTPVLFMKLPGTSPLSRSSYRAIEVVQQSEHPGGAYQGPLWNTNAVAIADFDGDGHPDIGVFNYFPDSQVLDPNGLANVQMNHSMSTARNAGGAHMLRWVGAVRGPAPSAMFQEQSAFEPDVATGWTLAAASADLDGDLLPELYVANDFGNDRFFHNVSRPGNIQFRLAEGRRGPFTPKSLVLGWDSFKGMGVDFADLFGSGRFDMFVSNITTSWGLEESNHVWRNTAAGAAEAGKLMRQGIAPYDNVASETNLAWAGWAWDVKLADFDNSGRLSVVQACGFIDGQVNRWPWLQEFVISNDLLLSEPDMWPHMRPGDDVAGDQPLAFWVREDNGRFVNLSPQLGITDTTPTRGIAIGDTEGDGAQDFAVARQWGAPVYYRNERASDGAFLGLRLFRPAIDGTGHAALGSPAYGAQVRITAADGRQQVSQLDGGSGHSGKRSFDVFFGLGDAGGPVTVDLSWRDLDGDPHRQRLTLPAGWHDLMLTDNVQEV
ncbi:CRTAC1 family protein [Allorhizocola rhizosphaerae]|uniref:CRTAC1 family protein n=1 Tax=Allorhizocola rhizosphaerae TaxID=1872709 RepID=UPI000E3BD250|nr:CRTAC1 family protein [Allorhizocola rhizosphaerae]